MFLFIIMFSTTLIIYSHINLCKKCKYFIQSESYSLSKCKQFLRMNYHKNTMDNEYCYLAREIESMCGKNGKKFVEKVVEK